MRRSSAALARSASLGLGVVLALVTSGPAVLAAPSRPAPNAAASASADGPAVVSSRSARASIRATSSSRPVRHVDVSKLPKNSHPRPLYQPKLHGHTPASTGGGTGKAPSGLLVDEVPTEATVTETSPVVEAVSGAGTSDPTGAGALEPPDSYIAVGPDTVVQSTNVGLRMTDRTLGTVNDVALQDFFGITAIPDYQAASFDPRVLFDSVHQRWIAIETGYDCYPNADTGAVVGTGYIDVAVSDTADPRLSWTSISIAFIDQIPDFPGLGTSTDKVVLSSNLFDLVTNGDPLGCGFEAPPAAQAATEVDVLSWADLIAGNANIAWFSSLDNTVITNADFTFLPAVAAPALTSVVHGIFEHSIGGGATQIGHFAISGVPSGPVTMDRQWLPTSLVAGFTPPASLPAPTQPGAPATISDAVDGRPTDAVWQNNRLVFASTAACDPSGGAVETRDCVRVTELSTSTATPTMKQDFLIAKEGEDLYMGGVGLTGNSDLHVVWTQSSAAAGDYPSTYAAYQLKGAAAGTLAGRAKIAAGGSTYLGGRWGDYVGVAQDPQVADAVWVADEVTTAAGPGAGDWTTETSQLRTFGGAAYVPITPTRILDTRIGTGLANAFVANTSRTFGVGGISPIPSGAIAVTGNVTVVGQTGAGYVTITPAPNANPTSSTINFPYGDVRANNFTLPLGSGGKLSAVYKSVAGRVTNLIVDITGYFVASSAATYHPLAVPARVIDTRDGTGLAGVFRTGTPRSLVVAGRVGIPANATAITGNLTVVNETRGGFLSVTLTKPTGTPASSTLNFPLGDTRANGLTAALDGTGALWITYAATAAATTNVILDVTGYYTTDATGLSFFPLNPGRIMDSRTTVLSGGVPAGILNVDVYKQLDTDGHWGVPVGAAAITGNLTVANQNHSGYLADTPTATAGTSTLNFPLGDVRANGLTTQLGSGDQFIVYRAGGSGTRVTHAILDLTGYFK